MKDADANRSPYDRGGHAPADRCTGRAARERGSGGTRASENRALEV